MQSPWTSLDVDERLPPIMNLVGAQYHAQPLAAFFMNNPLEFAHAYIMRMQDIPEKLNKMYVVHLKWQHEHTIDTFFKSR